MKNALKIAALVLVVATLAVMLVSCSKMAGTYTQTTLGVTTNTLVFKLNGKVETYAGEIEDKEEPLTVSYYKIKDDKIYTWDGDKVKEDDAVGVSFNKGKDATGSFIEIAGIKYYKK